MMNSKNMKKIILATVAFLASCGVKDEQSFVAGTYKLIDSMHDVPTIMSFSEDGKMNGKIVNVIMGEYTIQKNNITITPTGTTMMMGPEKDMEAEQNFIQVLPMIKTYKMQNKKLILITEKGYELIFAPINEDIN